MPRSILFFSMNIRVKMERLNVVPLCRAQTGPRIKFRKYPRFRYSIIWIYLGVFFRIWKLQISLPEGKSEIRNISEMFDKIGERIPWKAGLVWRLVQDYSSGQWIEGVVKLFDNDASRHLSRNWRRDVLLRNAQTRDSLCTRQWATTPAPL